MWHELVFDSSSCGGCLSCVVNCALAHEGINALSSARIHVDVDPFAARYPATYCRQCTRATCAVACPSGAIMRDPSREFWRLDEALCNGCGACIDACSFGAITHDPITDKVLKCDACAGDPICVRSCAAGALRWREVTDRSPVEKIMLSS
jgi:Fe-S-cluster-containing hydrogenase component 2